MSKADFKAGLKRVEERVKKNKTLKEPERVKVMYVESDTISLASLMQMEFPENQWLVEALIPTEGINIISGAPGNFKTWIMLHMAISISKGENFLEQFSCEKAGVLMIDEEDHLRSLKARLLMLGCSADLPIHFMSMKGFDVCDENWRKKVFEICDKEKLDVIFLDSLVRIHSGKENESGSMAKVFRAIRTLCNRGKTVIVSHHERKEGTNGKKISAQDRLRGSTDIPAALDSHIALKRDKTTKRLLVEHSKLKEGEEIPVFEVGIEATEDKMSFKYLGKPISKKDSRVAESESTILDLLRGKQLSTKDIIDLAGKNGSSEKLCKEALKNLVKQELVHMEKGTKNTQLYSISAVPVTES